MKIGIILDSTKVSWYINDLIDWIKKEFPSLSFPNICKVLRKGLIKVNKKKVTKIDAYIIVENVHHKQIILGKAGSMIKKIGIESRLDIEQFLTDPDTNLTNGIENNL